MNYVWNTVILQLITPHFVQFHLTASLHLRYSNYKYVTNYNLYIYIHKCHLLYKYNLNQFDNYLSLHLQVQRLANLFNNPTKKHRNFLRGPVFDLGTSLPWESFPQTTEPFPGRHNLQLCGTDILWPKFQWRKMTWNPTKMQSEKHILELGEVAFW